MKIDKFYLRQKCKLVIKGLCRYSRRVDGEGVSNDSVVVDNGNFSVFAGYFFGNFRDEASVVI